MAGEERLVAPWIVNALTVDVEDYFHVSAFASRIPRSQWDTMPCRVEGNIDRILCILEENHVKATFFTLGWVGKRYPELVRRITKHGHELASHGYSHERVDELSANAFLRDISLAKHVLEDISGVEVKGYRAPSFSIGREQSWALGCIEIAGYQYSSSIYPIVHDHYGIPDAPRFPYVARGSVLEIPLSTVRLFGRNWPAAGGGYFRLLPYAISRWCIRQINWVERQPTVFYFHPWELDPQQPRVSNVSLKSRFRHYLNLSRMEDRLRSLLEDFSWDRVEHVFLGRGHFASGREGGYEQKRSAA